ncbi:MAG: hypothetical protein M1814_003959 [Vezdaea aestivalis]|nr:MAG: hypothetical protein M1814_003959 [Vezdaea aestivalis]
MAKTLIRSYPLGTFEPTIFERSDSVGGLWPVSPTTKGRLDPQMRVNISRYVIGFSDLAWDAIGETATLPSKGSGSATADNPHVPLFPKAWQAGLYLETYAKRYIPTDRIKLNCNVLAANLLPRGTWHISWSIQGIDTTRLPTYGSGSFDYLVLATGFFATPRRFESLLNPTCTIPFIHSSDLGPQSSRLFRSGSKLPGDKIVVVGGSLSGAEAAASIAFQVSSARWSPDTSSTESTTEVIHLASKPFWNVPHLLPDSFRSKDDSKGHKSFFPNDFGFYDIARRLPEPIVPRIGPLEPEHCKLVHGYLHSIVGSNQGELSQGLQMTEELRDRPPSLGISENYSTFSQNGDISFVRGTLTSISGTDNEAAILTYKTADDQTVSIPNVASVVMATGYSPQAALEPLSKETLSILSHDSTSDFYPLLLDAASTHHPSLPTLAFVGFYRGPFWGIMEMQARSIAARWIHGTEIADLPDRTSDAAMRSNQRDPLRLQQFPMRDVAGLSETFARGLGIQKTPSGLPEGRVGMAMPARYLDQGSDTEEADRTMDSFRRDVRDMSGTKYVAKVVFRTLLGRWQIHRRLDSKISSSPSGTFVGEASFHPRVPTDDAFDAEYLYVEDGVFTTDNGLQFNGTRRYVYRYQELCDTLSVWFVKVEENKSVDYFFHELRFTPRNEDSEPNRFRATSSHLCVEDLYTPSYEFTFKGTNLAEFVVEYVVKGPQKDYTSRTRYTRGVRQT